MTDEEKSAKENADIEEFIKAREAFIKPAKDLWRQIADKIYSFLDHILQRIKRRKRKKEIARRLENLSESFKQAAASISNTTLSFTIFAENIRRYAEYVETLERENAETKYKDNVDALSYSAALAALHFPTFEDMYIKEFPNKRVIHLATHGKRRTRKKNINRILKYYDRRLRKYPEIKQN